MGNEKELKLIHDTIRDTVADFVYYDRKEDELLPRGYMEQRIKEGVITVDSICAMFISELREALLG